jgi:hypothetical protein
MPAKSQAQRKLIFALRNKYNKKKNTPKKWKWIYQIFVFKNQRTIAQKVFLKSGKGKQFGKYRRSSGRKSKRFFGSIDVLV